MVKKKKKNKRKKKTVGNSSPGKVNHTTYRDVNVPPITQLHNGLYPKGLVMDLRSGS